MLHCLLKWHSKTKTDTENPFVLHAGVLTWVGAVHVDEPGPVEVLQQGHERLLQLGPQLQDELVVGLHGEGRRDEADVQRATEGHQHVDRPPVIQTHDGVHALRELWADWDRNTEQEGFINVYLDHF